MTDIIDRYPRCRVAGTRWILVEAQDRIMPEIPASLAEFASRELRAARHRDPHGHARSSAWTSASAVLSTGERVPTRTVCWTAGVKPPPGRPAARPAAHEGRPDRGRRHDAGEGPRERLGDRRRRGGARPGAERRRAPARRPPSTRSAQGRVVGSNVAAALAGRKPRPFRYRTLGVFVDMGQHKAVATMLGLRLRGFPAWFAARTYHLAMMPGMARRVRLGCRLDRRPLLRARVRRARPARAPAVARELPRRGAAAGRGARRAS